MTTYSAQDFSRLLGMDGFSDELLKDHFKLYEGYVKNTNSVGEKLTTLEPGTPEYAELKRRFGWEFSGMRLHELYFENMTKDDMPEDMKPSELADNIIKGQFGSHDAFMEDFKNTGKMRGIGWVILYADPQNKNVYNTWIDEHALGHLAGCHPLLVMDVFEHAYIRDYGLDRATYIENFFKRIDWRVLETRLENALG